MSSSWECLRGEDKSGKIIEQENKENWREMENGRDCEINDKLLLALAVNKSKYRFIYLLFWQNSSLINLRNENKNVLLTSEMDKSQVMGPFSTPSSSKTTKSKLHKLLWSKIYVQSTKSESSCPSNSLQITPFFLFSVSLVSCSCYC